MNPDNVKNCMRCNASLERGYSSRWEGDKCKEVICFDCDKREAVDNHMKTGIITTHFMLDCMMYVYSLVDGDVHNEDKLLALLDQNCFTSKDKAKIKVQLSTARINKKIKEFEKEVWFKGLQDQVLATRSRGVSAKLKTHNNLCVLTYTIIGRTMITIEDDNSSVTCVADETSKESRTGYHAICATAENAEKLIDLAIELYKNGTLKFAVDDGISMI